MTQNRIEPKFIDSYIDKKSQLHEKKHIVWIKIIICLILFISIVVIQVKTQTSKSTSGIISQLQVIISTYMVVSLKKKGYIIAVAMNGLQSFTVAMKVLVKGAIFALPGIVVPLCTIITISIIFLFNKRLNDQIEEITMQREELISLYEEVTATEEELSQQNMQLIEYNQTMRENEKKLNQLAFFDVLTGLANRKMIINRIELLISLSTKKNINFIVVFIDLDNFKKINDSMGHHIGDLMLKAVSSKLKKLIHLDDMLGRLGGDEFALIIKRPLNDKEILEYIDNLRITLLSPFMIENMEFNISASFGISSYPHDGKDFVELLKCADMAMYKAKDHGKNAIQFFSKEMKGEILKKIDFENKLLAAIQNQELFLVFQPQYSSDLKILRGFEILVRWKSPELGFVSPTQFIPIAEETKGIVSIGEWILRTACRKFKNIQEIYNINPLISVNISAVQIMEPSFLKMIEDVLSETGFDPQYLELEVTESVFISSMEYVVEILNVLKNMGIRLALDDFGTGYSSLSYLQMLPIDTLKIDKTFIDSIDDINTKNQIVGSIISLVHQMDISIIAEGVENEIQLEYLKNHECDNIQGYLWGQPLKEEDLDEFIKKYTEELVS